MKSVLEYLENSAKRYPEKTQSGICRRLTATGSWRNTDAG